MLNLKPLHEPKVHLLRHQSPDHNFHQRRCHECWQYVPVITSGQGNPVLLPLAITHAILPRDPVMRSSFPHSTAARSEKGRDMFVMLLRKNLVEMAAAATTTVFSAHSRNERFLFLLPSFRTKNPGLNFQLCLLLLIPTCAEIEGKRLPPFWGHGKDKEIFSFMI